MLAEKTKLDERDFVRANRTGIGRVRSAI